VARKGVALELTPRKGVIRVLAARKGFALELTKKGFIRELVA